MAGYFRSTVKVRGDGAESPLTFMRRGQYVARSVIEEYVIQHALNAEQILEERQKETLVRVAKACPKVCGDCRALEVVSKQSADPLGLARIVEVAARCSSPGYCPNAQDDGVMSTVELELETPSLYGQLSDAADKVMRRGRYAPVEVEPSSIPKTKADLVW